MKRQIWKMNRFRIARLILVYASLLFSNCVYSESNDWSSEFDLHATLNSYQGSLTQNYLYSAGIEWRSQYLDSGAIGFGYTNRKNVGQAEQTDVEENLLFINGQYFYYPDSLPGKIIFEADVFYIQGSNFIRLTDPVIDPSPNPGLGVSANLNPSSKANPMSNMGKFGNITLINSSNDIVIVYPQISYLNYKKTFYVDVGYASSRYRYSDDQGEDVDVDQWTATVGVALNDQFDWLQTRVYSMELSNGSQTGGETSGEALELRWTHWFGTNAMLGIDNLTTSVMGGGRLFAVDPDSHIVYSISDKHIASVSLAAQWKISDHSRITAVASLDTYEDISIQDKYSTGYAYIAHTYQW